MAPYRTARALLVACLSLTGCDVTLPWAGSSQEEGSGVLSVCASALSFVALAGDALPAAQRLTVDFKRDQLVFGYPPGTPEPAWLGVSGALVAQHRAEVTVRPATTALAAGTYTTTLRLVTTSQSGSGPVSRDVAITYTVRQGLTAGPSSLAFTAVEGAIPAPQALSLSSDLATEAWTLSARLSDGRPADWVTLPSASGLLTEGAAHPSVGVAALRAGEHEAILEVRDGAARLRASIPVSYRVDSLAVAPAVAFTVDSATGPADVERVVNLHPLVDAATGAGLVWTAAPQVPWLSVTPAQGNLAAETALTVRFDPAQVAGLADGHHEASIRLSFAEGGPSPVIVPVTLDLALPQVDGVFPRVAWVGQGGPVFLRGAGFGAAGGVLRVTIDGRPVTATVVSHGARAVMPALEAEGTVQVAVANALGMSRAGASLTVLPAPGYTATKAEVSTRFSSITLDPERRAVFLAGYQGSGFERLRFDGNVWTRETVALPDAIAIAISADGRDLFTVASSLYGSLTVQRRDPASLAVVATETKTTYYDLYGFVAPFNDGRTLLVETDQWSSSLWTPGLAQGPSLDAWSPSLILTRDRNLLLVRNTNSAGLWTLEAGDTAFRTRPEIGYNTPWSASTDGGRIVSGTSVYDGSFANLGPLAIPSGSFLNGAAVAPDGRSAYLVRGNSDYTAWLLERADLSAAAGPYPVTNLTPPLEIPKGEYPVAMVASDDGGTLFLLTIQPDSYLSPERRFFYALPLP